VSNGGLDRLGGARFDEPPEADGSPREPTFDKVEGNSERLIRCFREMSARLRL
jgi:hypothetical protein